MRRSTHTCHGGSTGAVARLWPCSAAARPFRRQSGRRSSRQRRPQIGWRNTMLGLAAIEVALILPAAALMLGPAPEARGLDSDATGPRPAAPVFGLRPATALSMLAAAGF